ncbi:MAG: hypothetical protein QXP55_03280 [Nitrososphaerales archaeon]
MVEDTTLKNVDNRKIIIYNLENAIHSKELNLGLIILFIKVCKSLLKDKTDTTFVRQIKNQWDILIKAFSKAKPSLYFISSMC